MNHQPNPDWPRILRELEAGTGERIGGRPQSGFMEGLRRAAEAVIRDVLPALGRMAVEVTDAMNQGLAPNWRPLSAHQIVGVLKLMGETGWSLAWTPPPGILIALLDAPDRNAQERILLTAEGIILSDVEALVGGLHRSELADLATGTREVLESYRSGYYWAAQALATNVLTTSIHQVYGLRSFGHARRTFEKMDPEEGSIRELRLGAILSAVNRALAPHVPGDPPTATYNRHASTHQVSRVQYREFNGLASLMLLVSFLVETQSVIELIESSEGEDG